MSRGTGSVALSYGCGRAATLIFAVAVVVLPLLELDGRDEPELGWCACG